MFNKYLSVWACLICLACTSGPKFKSMRTVQNDDLSSVFFDWIQQDYAAASNTAQEDPGVGLYIPFSSAESMEVRYDLKTGRILKNQSSKAAQTLIEIIKKHIISKHPQSASSIQVYTPKGATDFVYKVGYKVNSKWQWYEIQKDYPLARDTLYGNLKTESFHMALKTPFFKNEKDAQSVYNIINEANKQIKISPSFPLISNTAIYISFAEPSPEDKNMLQQLAQIIGPDLQKTFNLIGPVTGGSVEIKMEKQLSPSSFESWHEDFALWSFPHSTTNTKIIKNWFVLAKKITQAVQSKDPQLIQLLREYYSGQKYNFTNKLIKALKINIDENLYQFQELKAWYKEFNNKAAQQPQWGAFRDAHQFTLATQNDDLLRFKALIKSGARVDITFEDVYGESVKDTYTIHSRSKNFKVVDARGREQTYRADKSNLLVFHHAIAHSSLQIFNELFKIKNFKPSLNDVKHINFSELPINMLDVLLKNKPNLLEQDFAHYAFFEFLHESRYKHSLKHYLPRMQLFLKHGFHNFKNLDIDTVLNSGYALDSTSKKHALQIVETMIKGGAVIDYKYHLEQALQYTPSEHSLRVIGALLTAGATFSSTPSFKYFLQRLKQWKQIKGYDQVYQQMNRAYKKHKKENPSSFLYKCRELLAR